MSSSAGELLFVDAYDSFSENIISLLRDQLKVSVLTIRIDSDINGEYGVSNEEFFLRFKAIVLGPGPGNPSKAEDIGLFSSVWDIAARHQIPVLGICLGFQSLCLKYGMELSRLSTPCHGHAKIICHDNSDIFRKSGTVEATCYNSLGVRAATSVETPPISRPPSRGSDYSSRPVSSRASEEFERRHSTLEGTTEIVKLAWDQDGWLQGARHRDLPFWGVQFHPESCKSSDTCNMIIRNWWRQASIHRSGLQSVASRHHQKSNLERGERSSTGKQEMLSYLLDRSPASQQVCSEKLHMVHDRQSIATLCYELSKTDHISMLESSKKGRYSLYACTDEETWTLEYASQLCKIVAGANVEQYRVSLADAVRLVEEFMTRRLIVEGPADSPFWGGLIGYFSYELGLDLLNIDDPLENNLEREVPDYSLMWIDRSIVVDKLEGTIYVQSLRPNDQEWISRMTTKLHTSSNTTTPAQRTEPITSRPKLPSQTKYISQINDCLSELHDGNSYELCLTTSIPVQLATSTQPFELHQQLLRSNPSTYSALLIHPSVTILSSSPEQFVSWPRPTLASPDTNLNMQPMKGTLAKYPGLTPAMASKLLRTPKEEAENLMIVDLIRHDLARALSATNNNNTTTPNSPSLKVTVPKLFELVEAETVYQLISHIQATVPASLPPSPSPSPPPTSADTLLHHRRTTLSHACSALRHTLPPGSMTGAPKKRSCEILRSLERRNRGVYAGVIGYLDVGGGGAWSVAIRCAFSANAATRGKGGAESERGESDETRTWHVGAGGAITVLSDAQAEWEEMSVKMDSVLRGFRG